MTQITQLDRVLVPVSDQDAAIAFYTSKLGFTLTVDVQYAETKRWVEVTPPGGGAAIALIQSQGEYQAGRMTGISLKSADPKGDHAALAASGVDVDEQLGGGDGNVPLLFFFRDADKNTLMITQAR